MKKVRWLPLRGINDDDYCTRRREFYADAAAEKYWESIWLSRSTQGWPSWVLEGASLWNEGDFVLRSAVLAMSLRDRINCADVVVSSLTRSRAFTSTSSISLSSVRVLISEKRTSVVGIMLGLVCYGGRNMGLVLWWCAIIVGFLLVDPRSAQKIKLSTDFWRE